MPTVSYYRRTLLLLTACWLCCTTPLLAQQATTVISGRVTEAATGKPLSGADVFVQSSSIGTTTDARGYYKLPPLPAGTYVIAVFYEGLRSAATPLEATAPALTLDVALQPLEETLQTITVERKSDAQGGIARLQAVEGMAIYEAKKSEVILIDALTANLATNNSRQIYSKVPGLNIWESDGAGLQLGIGGRGLSPNRTSNFNTRQNGYDISADALGYPESYYTPPVEGVEKIQLVRGAASLQYGTQFGGMLNFVMKKGPEDKPFEFISRQTGGSFGLFNSFNSLGGTKGKVNYYGFYQYKRGDGYRPNSGFDVHTAFADLNMQLTEKFFLCLEYTHMNYLAQQPGGLTDEQFARDPRQSIRDRNWFKVNWNLMAVLMEYKFSPRSKLEMKNFGLVAGRDALGDLDRIDRDPNPALPRRLISDQFRNIGSELRLLQHYTTGAQPAVLVTGVRVYRGTTFKQQGAAFANREPDFRFLKSDSLASDHRFPNRNVALFAENIFNISSRLSLTPGIRYEWISTRGEGYYQVQRSARDEWGLPYPVTETMPDTLQRNRSVLLAGLGLSYKLHPNAELYGNISQNFRAVNFTDLRVLNENYLVDPNIRDEKGYSADLGIRGGTARIQYDASLFYLNYERKIGFNSERIDGIFKRVRRNLSDASIIGIETFAETDLMQWLQAKPTFSLRPFVNLALIRGRYNRSQESAYSGNRIELVPDMNLKTGLQFKREGLSLSWQYSYMGKQFTDATNTEGVVSNAIIGPIPAYQIMDLSGSYEIGRHLKLEGGINNLLNAMYFTRRAEGYPGPGIIPSDGRNFYLTIEFKY
ncbi:Iron(III) dicitrate transport protein FecA [Cesiribacter andamanensis AMV16]|uniref:Iron(III) dicitrate transport protein FecA n=1 Tax=Cesiribacter andamanensis AMV16 TaxID=1279009 RepID=M7NR49_9BACT|nr:Iron(III) dicitrate transport protein FecA [Cesiribacter andamanensis AMV16]